jgi:hypothetical protein
MPEPWTFVLRTTSYSVRTKYSIRSSRTAGLLILELGSICLGLATGFVLDRGEGEDPAGPDGV